MEPIIDHIEITVRDIEKALPFYDQVLPLLGYDLAHRSKTSIAQHDKCVVTYEHPRLCFAITSPRREFAGERIHRRRPGAMHHLAFKAPSRAEVDRLYARLVELGVDVVIPPRAFPEYTPAGYYALYFRDPEGLRYEIVTY